MDRKRLPMGTKCNYFSTMKAMSLIDLPAEEKTWLQHYGDMPENMCYREGSIYELLKEMVDKQPDAPALEFFDTVYSFKAMDENINVVANALKKLGVVEDESVTICMPNTPQALIAFYGANLMGAMTNMVHPLSSANEIEFYLRDADYDFDYCDKLTDGAKTCIEIMGKSSSEKLTAISTEELSELKAKADEICTSVCREFNDVDYDPKHFRAARTALIRALEQI